MLIIWTLAYPQQQVSGKVVNRDGAPQPGCLIEFVSNGNGPTYHVTSNNEGFFYLNNPQRGKYTVQVRRGQQRNSVTDVTIDDSGRLSPSTLVVSW
jgi:hypothetical protein